MDGHQSPRPTSALTSYSLRSRAYSISSDRQSTTRSDRLSSARSDRPSNRLTIAPTDINPKPAFIAASAAAQRVMDAHASHADAWYDQNSIEPCIEAVEVSDGALALVNGFLDQLLFDFLQESKSTDLSELREAIKKILKSGLASVAMAYADKELSGCIGGANSEDYAQPQGFHPYEWDVELVWRRTRLRSMVYSSLGDMEDADEDKYMKQEDREVGVDKQISDVIAPAVAIFLTDVIEYIGHLTLTLAGQAAYGRVLSDIKKGLDDGSRQQGDTADQIIVGEADVERVALDTTLGRIWRGWKKRLRSPIADTIPSPISHLSTGHSRRGSLTRDLLSPRSPVVDAETEFTTPQDFVEETIVEDVQPVNIPLPVGLRDVDEIEVPGLVSYSDDESEAEEDDIMPIRPKSSYAKSPDSHDLAAARQEFGLAKEVVQARQRSNSMPNATRRPFFFADMQSEVTTETQQSNLHADAVQEMDTQPNEKLVSGGDEPLTESRGPVPTGLGLTTPGAKINKKASMVSVADDLAWDSDGPEEVATFEKAEVVTSSRVSVDSSPSSSSCESAKKGHKRSTSSMHSARIIDVQAPRSPTSHPRQESLEHAQNRSASLSTAAAVTGAVAAAGATGAILATKSSHEPSPVDKNFPAPPIPPARRQVERAKPTIRNAGAISGSEEESDHHYAHGKDGIEAAAPLAPRGNVVSRNKRNPKFPMMLDVEKATRDALGTREPLSPRLVNTSYDGKPSPNPAMISGAGSPGHSPSPRHLHGFRDIKGPSPLEKVRTEEEDEEYSTALHSVGPARAIHTSGSSGSSATGKMKVVRSSEENSSTGRSGSVARNFEELIQSNQTITYTLTPESMRHADSSKRSLDSPVVTKFPRRSSETRSPITTQPSPTVSVSPSTFRGQGPENSTTVESRPSGPVPRAPTGIAVTTGRMDGPQARDARVPSETTSDFAQFIKSTGPPPESKQIPARKSNDNLGLSGPVPRAPESARRASTISNKGRFQPRDAAITSKNDTRDLIDFIRQGPPIAASNHRIPRHVAPFRTTMDSDQLAGAPGGKAVDANIPDLRYSQGSTNITEHSLQSSVHSNSALLKGRGGSSKVASMLGEDDMPMPQRKTHRVRDPYPIDLSDEEEDGEDAMPLPAAPPAKREESLAEFLRDYDPPAEPAAATRNMPRKKASAPSLMGRFTRSNTAKDTASIISVEGRSLNSRASNRGHIPIQINMPPGYDKYGAIETRPTGRPRISSASGPSGGRVPMKKFEPREPAAGTYKSETSDLAAFLRSSGPPEPPAAPAIRADEPSSGLGRMFGRRKKMAV